MPRKPKADSVDAPWLPQNPYDGQLGPGGIVFLDGSWHSLRVAKFMLADRLHCNSRGICPPMRAKFYASVAQWFWGCKAWPTWAEVEAWVESQNWSDPTPDYVRFIAETWNQNPEGAIPGPLSESLVKSARSDFTVPIPAGRPKSGDVGGAHG